MLIKIDIYYETLLLFYDNNIFYYLWELEAYRSRGPCLDTWQYEILSSFLWNFSVYFSLNKLKLNLFWENFPIKEDFFDLKKKSTDRRPKTKCISKRYNQRPEKQYQTQVPNKQQ